MAIIPITCTEEEYLSARLARTKLVDGVRAVKVTIDGDTTEYTQLTLKDLSELIAGMEVYRNCVSGNGIVAYNLNVRSGF